MLNETILNTGNMGEVLLEAHRSIAVPELLALYIGFSLIFLIVGLILIDTRKSGYKKFLQIYFISQSLVITFILLPLLFLPVQFNSLIIKLTEMFSLG
jgi:uncharacterized membrane protein YozB (DUF420 family)